MEEAGQVALKCSRAGDHVTALRNPLAAPRRLEVLRLSKASPNKEAA